MNFTLPPMARDREESLKLSVLDYLNQFSFRMHSKYICSHHLFLLIKTVNQSTYTTSYQSQKHTIGQSLLKLYDYSMKNCNFTLIKRPIKRAK